MIEADFQIVHAGQLVCIGTERNEPGPRRRGELSSLAIIPDGALAARDGKIVWVGPTDQAGSNVTLTADAIDSNAGGRVVTPGLIDAHTHPVFAAPRHLEFEMRAAGKSYQEIAAAGGGIRTSVAAMRANGLGDLIAKGRRVADRMLALGTTTAEAKSGYGLSLEAEIKLLEAIREVNALHTIDWVPTALAAHDFPAEYQGRHEEYVTLIVEEILPAIADRRLAEFNDIFFDTGVFDRAQTERIQTRARSLGFGLKFHVDELSDVDGAALAAEMGAVSADHLVFISQKGIAALADSPTVAVMLPGTAYFLDLPRRPPVRQMIEAGVAVAVATDCNPGSNMTESMPLAMNQACVLYKMSPAEVLVGGTLNAAWALGRAQSIGSLAIGKQCDLVVWDARDYREIAYHYGVDLAVTVIKNGKVGK
ncbi:MAG: imidazolonepropionase [candidate division Zixibacteria bacterium]|nr:imidazolonepropionase [candidate division Zixibacteria bacterium]